MRKNSATNGVYSKAGFEGKRILLTCPNHNSIITITRDLDLDDEIEHNQENFRPINENAGLYTLF